MKLGQRFVADLRATLTRIGAENLASERGISTSRARQMILHDTQLREQYWDQAAHTFSKGIQHYNFTNLNAQRLMQFAHGRGKPSFSERRLTRKYLNIEREIRKSVEDGVLREEQYEEWVREGWYHFHNRLSNKA